MDSPFRQAKARGFISSTELSMKQSAVGAPGPEGRSRFQKVSLVSRRLESTGSMRGREGSPSRVSLLLQAWEREIVEKTASSPTTLTHRERSSSINLLKDFTAHGPIFSQVYSPAQKPRRQDERGKAGADGGGDGIPPSFQHNIKLKVLLGLCDIGDCYICLEKHPFVETQILDWQLGDIFRPVREARLKKQEGKALLKQQFPLINAESIPDGRVVA